jgi:hypothetical protein
MLPRAKTLPICLNRINQRSSSNIFFINSRAYLLKMARFVQKTKLARSASKGYPKSLAGAAG